MTDSSWVSIRFQSQMFRFYSTDGSSGRYYMSSQIFPLFIALVLMHLDLLVMFVAQISTSFSIPVPHVCALSQFLLYIFLLSHAELPWAQVSKQLCKSVKAYPVIEVSSFQGAQLSRWPLPPSPEDRNRSSFRNIVFPFSIIQDNGKSSKSQ
jgi:hypothetical protein